MQGQEIRGMEIEVPQGQLVVVEEEQDRGAVAAEQRQCCGSRGATAQRLLAVRSQCGFAALRAALV